MSTSNLGLGIPFPKMLPITGTWAVPISLYAMFLSGRIVYYRVTTNTLNAEMPSTVQAESKDLHPMTRAVRSLNNYTDTAPLAVALAAILELNGASKTALNYALGLYFASRVIHLEGGLMPHANSMGIGRPIGYFTTQGLFIGGALYLASLVKGYWGF